MLIRAKDAGPTPSARDVLEGTRRQGYWLSDAVLETATWQAGETTD